MKCESCRNYDPQYPQPKCLCCKSGKNDDYRKPDYYEKHDQNEDEDLPADYYGGDEYSEGLYYD